MVTIERKGSDNLAKSGAITVDQPNLGQAPRAYYTSLTSSASVSRDGPLPRIIDSTRSHHGIPHSMNDLFIFGTDRGQYTS